VWKLRSSLLLFPHPSFLIAVFFYNHSFSCYVSIYLSFHLLYPRSTKFTSYFAFHLLKHSQNRPSLSSITAQHHAQSIQLHRWKQHTYSNVILRTLWQL
jgi:hypothetical protein